MSAADSCDCVQLTSRSVQSVARTAIQVSWGKHGDFQNATTGIYDSGS